MAKDPTMSKKSTIRKKADYLSNKKVSDTFNKEAKKSLKNAQKMSKDLINKYGNKSVSSLKYDKNGRLKDNKAAERVILNTIAYIGAYTTAALVGNNVGIAYVQRSPQDLGRSMYGSVQLRDYASTYEKMKPKKKGK